MEGNRSGASIGLLTRFPRDGLVPGPLPLPPSPWGFRQPRAPAFHRHTATTYRLKAAFFLQQALSPRSLRSNWNALFPMSHTLSDPATRCAFDNPPDLHIQPILDLNVPTSPLHRRSADSCDHVAQDEIVRPAGLVAVLAQHRCDLSPVTQAVDESVGQEFACAAADRDSSAGKGQRARHIGVGRVREMFPQSGPRPIADREKLGNRVTFELVPSIVRLAVEDARVHPFGDENVPDHFTHISHAPGRIAEGDVEHVRRLRLEPGTPLQCF